MGVPQRTAPPLRARATRRNSQIYIFVAVLAVVLLVPIVTQPFLGPAAYGDLIGVLKDSSVFVILTLGLNIVVGYAGLLDLGYAAFFAIGGYTMAFLTAPNNPISDAVKGIPVINVFWGALFVSFIMAALFGVLLGAPTLGLRGDYLAIVTLGFGEIVPVVFLNASDYTQGDSGLSNVGAPNFFGFVFSPSTLVPWYYLTLAVILLSIFLIRRMVHSRLGRAWQAMREDEVAAAAMGIDLVRTKLLAFGLGASFSGFAGGIYASSLGAISPSQLRFDVSIIVLAMVILGGMGNIWGVILGSALISIADRYVIANFSGFVKDVGNSNNIPFLVNFGTASRLLIFGLVLVIVMLVRPEGLLPNARRRAEFHEEAEEAPAPPELQATEETSKELLGLQGNARGVNTDLQ